MKNEFSKAGKYGANLSARVISEQISTLIDRLSKKGQCIVIWEKERLLFCSMDSRNAQRYLAKPTCLGVYDADVTFWDVQKDLKEILQRA
ncbi:MULTISPECIES: hypothetical protein [Aquitalea]|uniref:Uncharacterized protein n=1 Tax=Aquitalea magnusonii TaxID=332411 RepID=A0A318JI20_9NEIS|nr:MULTISPECIES: hypothetical protein [Aquitalea]PXX50454.1 hypothetical protein DFR38_102102 [Aquitalea magnusonii]